MKNILLVFILFISSGTIFAQLHLNEQSDNQTPTANYRLAAKYSPDNLAKLVHSTAVKPHWLKIGNRFWYQYKTTEGANY